MKNEIRVINNAHQNSRLYGTPIQQGPEILNSNQFSLQTSLKYFQPLKHKPSLSILQRKKPEILSAIKPFNTENKVESLKLQTNGKKYLWPSNGQKYLWLSHGQIGIFMALPWPKILLAPTILNTYALFKTKRGSKQNFLKMQTRQQQK